MVFQSYALYPNMTVAGNISFGMEMRGVPVEERKKAIDKVAKVLQITHLLDRKPSQLSGGQRQRVAMGRALVREPAAFLFDEPLSNLDAKLRVQMRVEIRRLQRRLGTTSLYVTHDQIEALTLADRLVVLNAGRVEQIGTPTEVYDRPATLFVAGFIDTPPMNILPAGYLRERIGGLPDAWPAAADLLGIRPDDLLLAPPDGPHVTLPATLDLLEPAGAEAHLYVRLDGLDTPVTARAQGRPILTEGGPVMLHARPGDFHAFVGGIRAA
jgi:sn-glycerol 3-phosphate transport system ATP-binding protein